jgi:2-O-(6-phospho-alpha-D-mannosyl)-D-glycerate hydrolase
MDGQTVVIDDYLEIRPEAKARLERAIRSGQIQVGPWYTLPDEFLVSGETLVRNLQRGLASAERHGGSMRVGYLPDSFGHTAQMPQIYRQLGFAYAAVWRGVPLAIDRVAFSWEAPDASSILTAYMGNSYSHGVDLPTEPDALAARIAEALQAIEPFRPPPDILLMNGNDHVLPQRTLSAAIRGAGERLKGTRVRLARLDDYLATLPQAGWPVWRGELRSSARANVLMGTLSVRVPDKQRYFRATLAVERQAEPLAALSGVAVQGLLDQAWTWILQNAAHDTACGSGIDAVAEEARLRSHATSQIADEIIDRCLPRLAGDGQVWNPSPFQRQGLVEIGAAGAPSGGQVVAPAMEAGLGAQVDRVLVATPMIAGMSVATLARAAQPPEPVTASGSTMENAYLRCDLSGGTLTVLDKRSGVRYEGLHRLVDEGDAGDEYNFSPPAANEQPASPIRSLRQGIVESGPLRARFSVKLDLPVFLELSPDRQRRSDTETLLPVRQAISLQAGVPRLDIELEIKQAAHDHRLRVHFPLPFQAEQSAADTPFHVTRRGVVPAHRDPGAPEVELPTYPMRSFVDVSDGRHGVALITEGLHEYEVLPGSPPELALTLLRAVGWLSRDDLRTRTGHAGPGMPTPGAQVLGVQRFRYSLFFHAGDWESGKVWRAAEETLLPLLPGRGMAVGATSPLVQIEPASIQMTACVPRGDGYDLRLLNASDVAHEAIAHIHPEPKAIAWISLGGELRQHLPENDARLALRPWEIATLRVTRRATA